MKLHYENEDRQDLIPALERKGYRTSLLLYINGEQCPEDKCRRARPDQTLLSFLRDEMQLTGTKLGCAEGGCGACTVMISRYNSHSDSVEHFSVNACLMPVCSADLCHVTTIEGVGSTKNGTLHPIQERMVAMHGSQCGFCTPGIIVALYSLFASGHVRVADVEEHFDGNLCRCTGYRPIWDAAKSLCVDAEATGPCGEPCVTCPSRLQCDIPCNTSSDKGRYLRCDGEGSPEVGEEDKKEEKPETCDGNGGKLGSMVCTSSTSKFLEKQFRARLPDIKYDEERSTVSRCDQPNTMFPDELVTKQMSDGNVLEPLIVASENCTWVKPCSLQDLLELMEKYPDSKIVVGNTEVGIETKFKHEVYRRFISPSSIPELTFFEHSDGSIVIGACTPLSTIQCRCEKLSDETSSSSESRTARAIVDMLRWFASTQIRNSACLGGNLATASPISDMNPLLASMGSTLNIMSATRPPRAVSVGDFFLSYRKVDLRPEEVILSINVPKVASVFEYIFPFKQARRREDDISIVTAGMRVKITPSKDRSNFLIVEASFAFGGMAPKTVFATKTARNLIGMPWREETFINARRDLALDLALGDDVPGGQVEYRRALAASFLFKFYIQVTLEIAKDVNEIIDSEQSGGTLAGLYSLPMPSPPVISDCDTSGGTSFVSSKKPSISGTQIYPHPKITPGAEDNAAATLPKLPLSKPTSPGEALGVPVTHASGALHCTGEAVYVDDIPQPLNMLHAALILSDRTNCRLATVDKTEALTQKGVVGVFTHEDLVAIRGSNKLGPIVKDEEVFATGEIRHVGMVIGVVVAETLELANAASRSVKVTYEDMLGCVSKTPAKPIVSIEDAVQAGSFYEQTRHVIECGNVEAELQHAEEDGDAIIVTGEYRVGGQEHFYLECHSTLVVPTETGLEVFSSTQSPTKTQMFCASATNTPASQVTCRVKRMGGGFGGKETRNVFCAAAAAVAAKITRRPVRCTLDRNIDMAITGNRHSFQATYTATAMRDPENPSAPPKLGALKVMLYSNAGGSLDLSGPIIDRALFHIDGAYKWSSFRAEGVACKTMQPPHTAFRGFGGPQGIAICEHVIDHLASASSVDIDAFRRANFYCEGDNTPFGMTLVEKSWNVPEAWDRLCSRDYANIAARRAAVEDFNEQNRWKKRGLAVIPTKFGIAFTAKFMNQGGALVHLYTDGTLLVSHGGTEMGQGLHTKVAQVAAFAFGVPLSAVHIEETATDKVANTMPSAASQSTDLYGMATLEACRKILSNIKPYQDRLGPNASLAEVATAAHFHRVDLSAHGFYIVPHDRCGYDWDAKEPHQDILQGMPENRFRGQPFNYFTQGVAASEVEIDVLSGDHRTIQSDVMVDVGSSLNPAIDIGQIEGAFIQGMGWSTVEEMIWADGDHKWVQPPGRLFTQGPGTYKIPAFNDTPETFNVTLMDTVNPFAVHSSKAIGEPPFFLGSSVFFAVKEAIRAARIQEMGDPDGRVFSLRMPGTSERVRMMCGDKIAAEGIIPALGMDEENGTLVEKRKKAMEAFQPKGSY